MIEVERIKHIDPETLQQLLNTFEDAVKNGKENVKYEFALKGYNSGRKIGFMKTKYRM